MKERISVTIERRTIERLKLHAHQEHLPVSRLVELAIEEYLGRRTNPSAHRLKPRGRRIRSK